MPTNINDNRAFKAMTAAEADQLLQDIAKAECELALLAAIADRELTERKEKLDIDCKPFLDIIRVQSKILQNYIDANRADFKDPRAKKSNFGSYGLRNVSSLVIENSETLIAKLQKANRDDLLEIKVSLNKKAITAALKNGEVIPGAKIVKGELTFYKVSELLIDEAKKQAIQD